MYFFKVYGKESLWENQTHSRPFPLDFHQASEEVKVIRFLRTGKWIVVKRSQSQRSNRKIFSWSLVLEDALISKINWGNPEGNAQVHDLIEKERIRPLKEILMISHCRCLLLFLLLFSSNFMGIHFKSFSFSPLQKSIIVKL